MKNKRKLIFAKLIEAKRILDSEPVPTKGRILFDPVMDKFIIKTLRRGNLCR
jgi:hypothetical protein